LIDRADGNPFYLEELANYLYSTEVNLTRLETLELPDSLHNLVLSRLDRLGEGEKSTLKVASVIGRTFAAEWVWQSYPLVGSDQQYKKHLSRLDRLNITPLNRPEPQLEYFFKHAIIQEVVYESQPLAARQLLHERVGDYVEKAYIENLEQYTDLLAYHYGHSENRLKQIEYYRKAAEIAKARYANQAALEYYEKLLKLVAEAERVGILLAIGEIKNLTGDLESAEIIAEQALVLAGQVPDRVGHAQSLYLLGEIKQRRGKYLEALEDLAKARTFWNTGDSEIAAETGYIETVKLLGTFAEVYRYMGDFAGAREAGEEGLRVARLSDNKLSVAKALTTLGIIADSEGNYSEARKYYEESLMVYNELGYKYGTGSSLNNLGLTAFKQADYTNALSYLQESLALRRQIGVRYELTTTLNNLGITALEIGDYEAALRYHQESLELRREMEDKRGTAMSFTNLGLVSRQAGEYDSARLYYDESLKLCRELNENFGIAINLSNMGSMAFEQGDYLLAKSQHQESLEIRRKMGDKRGVATSLRCLAQVAIAQGNYSEAHELSEEAIGLNRALDNSNGIAQSLIDGGILALIEEDYTVAFNYGQESLALCRKSGYKNLIVEALNILGYVSEWQKDYQAAQNYKRESLSVACQAKHKLGMIEGLCAVASLYYHYSCKFDQIQAQEREAYLIHSARLVGAVAACAKVTRIVLAQPHQKFYAEVIKDCRQYLGEALFEAAFAEGQAMSLEAATAYVFSKAVSWSQENNSVLQVQF
jgi:tetratricopeptide (TPR) repeat protein